MSIEHYAGRTTPTHDQSWAAPRERRSMRRALWNGSSGPLLVALLLGLATFLLRAINLHASFDIFVDEITYVRLARSVARELTVELGGRQFHLHPPAFFFVEGAYLALIGYTGAMVDLVFAARYLNLGFAALSAIGLFMIGRRLAGWPAGAMAVLLFALDPFLIRTNSRNLLEPSALWWVLTGYWVLFPALHADLFRPAFRGRWRRRLFGQATMPLDDGPAAPVAPISFRRALGAGLLFGLALLTKDMTAFLTLLPLAICWLARWSLPRRDAAIIIGTTLLSYAVYPLTVALAGDWERFVSQKLHGFSRLIGAIQETGFNRDVGPSVVERALERLGQFGATYLLLAVGIPAVVLLFLLGGARSRLLAVWTTSAYALLTFCILVGTLEEQFFYFLAVPVVLSIAVAGGRLFGERLLTHRRRDVVATAFGALVLIFVLWSGYHWGRVHFTPSNGYEQVLTFLQQNVPPDSKVASTSETGQFLLGDYESGPWGAWTSVDKLQEFQPDYLLVSYDQVAWDHGESARPMLDWVERHGKRVYTFEGLSGQPLVLYQLSEAW